MSTLQLRLCFLMRCVRKEGELIWDGMGVRYVVTYRVGVCVCVADRSRVQRNRRRLRCGIMRSDLRIWGTTRL